MVDMISVDPQIHFGKPCIKGTRITVENILALIKDGLTFTQILEDYYPDLENKDLKACVEYAMQIINAEEVHFATEAA